MTADRWRARSPKGRAITLLRLPLQVPLVVWAWRVARQGTPSGR